MMNKIMKNTVVALAIAAMAIPATGIVTFASENRDCSVQVSEDGIIDDNDIIRKDAIPKNEEMDYWEKIVDQESGLFNPISEPQIDPGWEYKYVKPRYTPEDFKEIQFDSYFLENLENELGNDVEDDTPDFSGIQEWMWVQV